VDIPCSNHALRYSSIRKLPMISLKAFLSPLATLLCTLTLSAQPDEQQMKRGAILYQQKCLMCHQIGGQGVPPMFPPLAGSDWMMADRVQTIKVLCEGKSGPITVNGKVFNNAMPAQIMNDEEVADVLSYAGQSWGNTMKEFTAAEVKEARKKSRYKTYEILVTAAAYQPLPKAPEGWTLSEVAQLPEMSTRLASIGPGKPVYVLAQKGGIYQLDAANKVLLPIIRADEYGISEQGDFGATGMTVDNKGQLWVVTNQRIGSDKDDKMYMNSVIIWRSSEMTDGRPGKLRPWFSTSYPQGGGPFNHGVSHMAFGPDGLLYVNSGARTDGGELGKLPKYHPGGEVDVTACLWRLDPKSEEPKIEVIARGLRNAYGFAWDDKDRLFSVSNGPDAHYPEEMDHIEVGKHYGFPYQFGNTPATEGSPYKHTPKAPDGLVFTMPVANIGPAAGGKPDAPCYTFTPHSCPGGMIWCGGEFPSPLRNSFLITRFGNLLDIPEDAGFDVLSAKMERKTDGTWQASVSTVLAPLGRPLDVLHTGGGHVLILEYTRPTNFKSKLGWLPGRILELAPMGKSAGK